MKKIYLILALLLLSGCSINYNLSISDDGIFKETITGTVADKELDNSNSTSENIYSYSFNNATPLINEEGTYNKNIIDKNKYKEFTYTYIYDNNYKSSNIQEDDDTMKLFKNAKSNQGESFVSVDGTEWNDVYNLNLGENVILKDTNVTIKAFTTQGNEKINVTGVELNKTSLSMNVGETSNLVATVKPENAQNKNVKWTSSNENIATVNEEGIITAVAEGEAKITVTTLDGNYTAECNVTVKKASNSDNDIYKDNNNNGNGYSEKNGQNSNDKVANGKLPQTGAKSKGILIIGTIIFVVILYKKCKKYKNIK